MRDKRERRETYFKERRNFGERRNSDDFFEGRERRARDRRDDLEDGFGL